MKKNDKWEDKIQPNLDKKEVRMRKFLTIFGLFVIVVAIAALIYAIRLGQYPIAYVCIGCLIIMVISWLRLLPKLHNTVHSSTKILPVKQDFNLTSFLTIVLNTKTPYGPPKLGFQVEDMFLRVPTYILKDYGYLIYFYIRNGNIVFKTMRYRDPNYSGPYQTDHEMIEAFQEKLIDYFCFVINEERKPEEDEIERIFKGLPGPKNL